MKCWYLLTKMMYKFYLILWLKWSLRLTLCSLLLASGISLIITIFLYFKLGMPILNVENLMALGELFKFWLKISWNGALLIAMFRSVKYIFNSCRAGYEFKLLSCQSLIKNQQSSAFLQEIGYGDLVKVWRRWFMLIIWLVGGQMIFALAYTLLFTEMSGVFEWFNIYWLYTFTLVAAYLSLILLDNRCERVRLTKC